jgi:hypothetical protein
VRCKNCHYLLSNLPPVRIGGEHRCPECGRAFDPADPTTWTSEALIGRRRLRWVWLVALIALLLFFIAAFIPVLQNYPVFGP